MKNISDLFISNNVTLKHHKLIRLSLFKIYGVNQYRANIILTLISFSVYLNYDKVLYKHYAQFNNIFNYLTFNINIFKKKSDLYIRRRYLKNNCTIPYKK
ncbi:ABC-type Mn2+/Zn2+ transport systems, permease components (apicoplast) [Babesia ovis]|uniref:ABC-type Mn2+/Zn2+ transport systems, permease components n=1 Tax=Babesia ovis TaxID=5869 RepID=A0A9W5TDN7_BABOV|nr:ABC-type Mn2+/Zn2+ transport systems, permease components [Babesia ovis]